MWGVRLKLGSPERVFTTLKRVKDALPVITN